MGRISKYRPSPGTAFGFTALVIALGGAAFAAIPDSSGTIHGCYQKSNGNLRVVESAADCKSSERAVSWGAESRPGSGVVARATSTGPVQSATPAEFQSPEAGANVPMTDATWTQRSDETNRLVGGVVAYTPPPACKWSTGTGFLWVGIYIDGEWVGQAATDRLSGTSARIRPTSDAAYLYEPAVLTPRRLTVKAADPCEDGNHFTVNSVKVSVEGIR